jgi:hypothetical protein
VPQIGNRCPGINEVHTFESRFCIDSCDHQCMPASVLVHIQNKQRVDPHQGFYISATALVDSACPRQLYYERTIDYYVEPRKNWWSIRGTLLHQILQNPDLTALLDDIHTYVYRAIRKGEAVDVAKAEELVTKIMETGKELSLLLPSQNHIKDWDAEISYQWDFTDANGNPARLYGTIDVLRRELKQIIDYKTIGDKGLPIIKNGAKPDHEWQFNIYRFLVEKGHPVGVKPEDYQPVEIEKITAYYMTMMEIVQTGGLLDVTTGYQVKEPDDGYLTKQIIAERDDIVTKKGKRKDSINPADKELSHKVKYRLTYAIPEVKLRPLEEVEAFIRRKSQVLIDAFQQSVVPDMCAPDVREWKCDDYCHDAIRAACDAHNAKVGTPRVVAVIKPAATEIQVEA